MMNRNHPENPSKIRRYLPTAVALAAIGIAVSADVFSGDQETSNYPQQPEYSCAENPRGYVMQRIGEQSITVVMGLRAENEGGQLDMGDIVTITGDKKELTVMLPNGSRLVYPEQLEVGQSVELSDTENASVRMAYVDGEPAIGVACSPEAWDGTVFGVDTVQVPLQQANN